MKLQLPRMTLSHAMLVLKCDKAAPSDSVHGDWTHGPLLDPWIRKGIEKLAVTGHCLHHPGHPH